MVFESNGSRLFQAFVGRNDCEMIGDFLVVKDPLADFGHLKVSIQKISTLKLI